MVMATRAFLIGIVSMLCVHVVRLAIRHGVHSASVPLAGKRGRDKQGNRLNAHLCQFQPWTGQTGRNDRLLFRNERIRFG